MAGLHRRTPAAAQAARRARSPSPDAKRPARQKPHRHHPRHQARCRPPRRHFLDVADPHRAGPVRVPGPGGRRPAACRRRKCATCWRRCRNPRLARLGRLSRQHGRIRLPELVLGARHALRPLRPARYPSRLGRSRRTRPPRRAAVRAGSAAAHRAAGGRSRSPASPACCWHCKAARSASASRRWSACWRCGSWWTGGGACGTGCGAR